MINRNNNIRAKAQQFYEQGNTQANLNQFESALKLYQAAVNKLRQLTKNDWHIDDCRDLSTYQNQAGVVSQDNIKGLKWHEMAIRNFLTHIPEPERSLEDWRDLAIYQNNAGITCKNPEIKLQWYQKAIETIEKHIPIQNRTLDDWRDLANYQNNMGLVCKNPQDQFLWHEMAAQTLLLIPEQYRYQEDWYNLSNFQNNAGTVCGNVEQEIQWYEKAIQNFLHYIPELNRTPDDWRTLSTYYGNIGGTSTNPEVKYTSYKSAMDSLMRISHHEQNHDDWRAYSSYAIACETPEKLKYHEYAIQTLMHIPANDRTEEDWLSLGTYQIATGKLCQENNQWKSAQLHLHAALETFTHCIDHHAQIATIYKMLQSMELSFSINKQLYTFAHDLFSNKSYSTAQAEFQQWHLAVINSPNASLYPLYHQLIQLMRLIVTCADYSLFPSDDIKQWLSNENKRDQFKQMLKEVEQAYHPISLLNTIDQTKTFSVAVAHQLLIINTMIEDLQARVEDLTVKQTHLQNTIDNLDIQNSHYQGHFTTFKKTSVMAKPSLPENVPGKKTYKPGYN